MAEDFSAYLASVDFEKYLRNLKRKLKDKRVIIYGSGSLFMYIKDNYDISDFNIIGISDMKFSDDQEGEEYLGYKVIPKLKMADYNPDYVIVATQNYIGIVEDFECNYFDKTKIKVKPLVKMPLLMLLKKIWSR